MYRISINDSVGATAQWWISLVNYIVSHTSGEMQDYEFKEIFTFELKKYNAVDVPGTPYIDFETAEDCVVFKLKFGL